MARSAAGRRRYSIGVILIETLAILSVAGFLAAVHALLPPGAREDLAFSYADSGLAAAVTAAYVHSDVGHLSGNVGAYVVVAVLTYVVCLWTGQRRWYWLTVLSLLTLLPVFATGAGIAMVRAFSPYTSIAGWGFSGVVAGFVGFLAVTVPVVLRLRCGFSWRAARGGLWAVLFFVLAAIGLRVTGTLPPALIGTVCLGLALVGLDVARAWRSDPAARPTVSEVASAVVIVVGLSAAVFVYVAGLFPTDLGPGSATGGVIVHFSGLVGGIVIAGWGYRYWGTPAG